MMTFKNEIHMLVGQKMKTSFIKEGVQYYINKLNEFALIKYIEPGNEKSFEKHCKTFEKDMITIMLDVNGRQFTSETFSVTWNSLIHQRAKNISFIIGGPYGFHYKPRSDLNFSLSNLTYNHELVPLVLLEQVYRAYSIIHRRPYHHA